MCFELWFRSSSGSAHLHSGVSYDPITVLVWGGRIVAPPAATLFVPSWCSTRIVPRRLPGA